MTPDIILVFAILLASVLLLVTEIVPMEVTALLVLGAAAVTGLVSPAEAISGFSSPAVVTVWAVFILSGGLTQTGVANIIGRFVLKVAGRQEAILITVIMLCAGGMSAIMNNVAVAALMLPVVMDIARQTGTPSARLLLPLAYGSLLGGLTTQIGTPPNILVTDALRENGLTPFRLFDFTPVGVAVMVAGTVFMALVGRRLLPDTGIERKTGEHGGPDLVRQYQLKDRTFRVRVPSASPLVGRSLAEARLGAVLGLNVLAVNRRGKLMIAPLPSQILSAEDGLIVEGTGGDIDALKKELRHWGALSVEPDRLSVEAILGDGMQTAEVRLSASSDLAGKTLAQLDFRNRYGLQVLAVRRKEAVQRARIKDLELAAGTILLVQGPENRIEELKSVEGLENFHIADPQRLSRFYHLEDRLLSMKVDPDSILVGKTLRESRLGELIGAGVLSIIRDETVIRIPDPSETLRVGDRLLILGRKADFDVLRHLGNLEIQTVKADELATLETRDFGLAEAMLSPHTTLAGKTLKALNFREKFGLSALAIWREGKVYESALLGDMALQFGDALLLFGPREKLQLLAREPDFLVLTESARDIPETAKAKVSVTIMAAVLLPVLAGWLPISIAAVIGAAVMVLTRCLTMEEAYRAIEWKGIFLIAGMMPLGMALDSTGAARFLASSVVGVVGPFGPLAVMVGLMVLTFLATCVIPTAALVVLMTPIVLSTAADMGVSPYALMMAMAMAASASFMTPISHPANVMVMGPGGYRFRDYLRVGVPLTAVVLITVVVVLPLLWPFSPLP